MDNEDERIMKFSYIFGKMLNNGIKAIFPLKSKYIISDIVTTYQDKISIIESNRYTIIIECKSDMINFTKLQVNDVERKCQVYYHNNPLYRNNIIIFDIYKQDFNYENEEICMIDLFTSNGIYYVLEISQIEDDE